MKYLFIILLFISYNVFAGNPFDTFLGAYTVKSVKCSADAGLQIGESPETITEIQLKKYENKSQFPEYWISYIGNGKSEHNISVRYNIWKEEYFGDANFALYVRTNPNPDIWAPGTLSSSWNYFISKIRIENGNDGTFILTLTAEQASSTDINQIVGPVSQCEFQLIK